MRKFTAEEIQNKFDSLPKASQEAVSSVEVAKIIQEIGKQHGLLIDQTGELIDLVGLVMLGLVPSGEFVKNFSGEAGVDYKTASAIADEINTQVFSKIRETMRSAEQNQQSANDISALEKVGGFRVEKTDEGDSAPANDLSENDNISTAIEKKNTLSAIENPQPSKELVVRKDNDDDYSDPMVDHLLGSSSTQKEKIVKNTESAVPTNLPTGRVTAVDSATKVSPPVPKPKGPDMYREPVE